MEYTTRLPAAHLEGDSLSALEDALTAGCTSPELSVELDHGSVTYQYSSLSGIGEDVTLPDVIRSFEVSLTAREGRLELVSDDRENEFCLQLTGDREWVESKRRSIERFFEARGAAVRTFLERYMALCLGFAAVGIGLLLYYSGLGAALGMGAAADSLLFGSLALMAGGILHLLLSVVYPYAALITSSRASSYLVYLRK